MGVRETDQQLVERAQKGDTRAFDLLVKKYQHKILGLISRYVQDHSEVQDVAQEAFIKAYRALGSFRAESAFYTWMYRIAINTAKNYLVSRGDGRRAAIWTSVMPRSSTRAGGCRISSHRKLPSPATSSNRPCSRPSNSCPTTCELRSRCASSMASPMKISPRSWSVPWAPSAHESSGRGRRSTNISNPCWNMAPRTLPMAPESRWRSARIDPVGNGVAKDESKMNCCRFLSS